MHKELIIKTIYGIVKIVSQEKLFLEPSFIFSHDIKSNNTKIIYHIRYFKSNNFKLKIIWKNIIIEDKWINNIIPKSIIVFINHLLMWKSFKQWDIVFHWCSIYNQNIKSWSLIIWDAWAWKTSTILKLISWNNNIKYLTNTKTIINSETEIINKWWIKIISARKKALNYYNEKQKEIIYNNYLTENPNWIYFLPNNSILEWEYNINNIFIIKQSNVNTITKLEDNFENIVLLNSNINQITIPVIFNEDNYYYSNFLLKNKNNIEKSIKKIIHNVNIYTLEWSIDYISNTIIDY